MESLDEETQRRLLEEVGETLIVSSDQEIIAAVLKAKEQIERGEIIWPEPCGRRKRSNPTSNS